MIDQIIDFNKSFVEQKGYETYLTDKYPDKGGTRDVDNIVGGYQLAVLESWCSPLSCMDTRLTELLPAALGLKNGDAFPLFFRDVLLLLTAKANNFAKLFLSLHAKRARTGCTSAKSKLSAFGLHRPCTH